MGRAHADRKVGADYEEGGEKIHDSHDMGEWYDTLCTDIGRFGKYRNCLGCGAEDLRCGGAGSRWLDRALLRECPVEEAGDDGE